MLRNNGDMIHARIQEFLSGGDRGVQVSLTKKALTKFFFFFSPQLILQKSDGQFQIYHLSRFQRGSNIFQGGSNFFQGGGGGCPIAYSL